MSGNSGNGIYGMAAAVALAAAVIQLWMNLAVGIVGNEENPANLGFYMVIVTAAACAFTARFRAELMARAMLATAGVQALLAMVVATAPSNASEAMGVAALSSGFTLLWLMSAALFHRSARLIAEPALA